MLDPTELLFELSDEVEDKTDDNTDNDTRCQGEIEGKMFSLDEDIARKLPEEGYFLDNEQNDSDKHEHSAKYDNEFAHLVLCVSLQRIIDIN